MPVVPRTPGAIALIGLASFSRYSGAYFNKCLVISMSLITFGPNESGVTYTFPSPTTNISPSLSVCLSIKFFNSFVTISDAFCISSFPAIFRFLISIVIYVPIGFPIASSPFSLVFFFF
jgi:hypothetical protein